MNTLTTRSAGDLGRAVLLVLAVCAPGCTAPRPSEAAVLDEVWALVRGEFYDKRLNGVDWDAARVEAHARLAHDPGMLSEIVNAMLAKLGASHTKLYTREDPAYYVLAELFWDAFEPGRRARFFPAGPPAWPGIGILVETSGTDSFVRGVLEGGSAARAGLRTGDRLIAVEGEPFQPVSSFRDRVGRSTRVRVKPSADPNSVRDVTLVPEASSPRAQFVRAVHESARIVERDDRRLAYVHLWSYAGEELHAALASELLEGLLADADGLVLDLRGGFGGANPEYLNLFQRDLPVLEFRGRDGSSVRLSASWAKPTVLLVDEGTTSGKEIFARAFQRQGRGTIVGVRTAGAVLGARAFLLANGSLLYLATHDVFVDGERLEGRGVVPDIQTVGPLPHSHGADPQLERALEALSAETGRAGAASTRTDPH